MDRLKNAIHYVIHAANSEKLELGATQLLKIILFSDVISFIRRRRAITGATFVKGKYGPVPDGHDAAIKALQKQKRIKRSQPAQKGESTRYISLVGPDLSSFTPDDLETLRKVTREVCENYTAAMISDLTHNDIWKMADLGEKIPLGAYFPRRVVPSTPEQIGETRAELEAMGYRFMDSAPGDARAA